MLDANLRHKKKGSFFIGQLVYSSSEKLANFGLTDGEYFICEMRSDEVINPEINIIKGEETLLTSHEESFYDKLIIFIGNVDGSSFRDEKEKELAEKLVKGCRYVPFLKHMHSLESIN